MNQDERERIAQAKLRREQIAKRRRKIRSLSAYVRNYKACDLPEPSALIEQIKKLHIEIAGF